MIRHLVTLCLLMLVATVAKAENIAPFTAYIPQVEIPYNEYDNGNEPCRLIAIALNAKGGKWSYSNPRYGTPPGLGTGCYFDETYVSTGQTTYNQFRQNFVIPKLKCVKGFSYASGQYCWRSSVLANKPCPPSSPCAYAGNPIATNSGAKIEHVRDVLTSSLTHQRSFLSYNTAGVTTARHMWGKGWHSDLTRQLSYREGNASAPATAYARRGDGSSVIFTKTVAGDWQAEADLVSYRLWQPDSASWVLEAPGERVEYYDARGQLLYESRNGETYATYQRDSLGRIEGVADRFGRITRIFYDSNGLVDRFEVPDGQQIRFVFDSSSRLTSVTTAGSTVTYGYVAITGNADTFLSAITHDGLAYATFGYDAAGRAISTEHSGGVDRFGVTYPSSTSASVITPLGGAIAYQFVQSLGNKLVTSRSETGQGAVTSSTTYAYDSNKNVISARRNGVLTCNYYLTNSALRLGSYTFPSNTSVCPSSLSAAEAGGYLQGEQTSWDVVLSKPVEYRTYGANNALVAKHFWTYNDRGQPLTRTQTDAATGATRSNTTAYCEQPDIDAGTCPLLGLVKSVNGPRTDVSDITTYTYYPSDDASCATTLTTCPHRKGDLWKVTNALGHVTETLKYDGAGRTLSMKDNNDVVTDLEYHPRGWLTARKVRGSDSGAETDDAITRIEYAPTGLVKKVTQPDGAFTVYTYDAAHRLTDIGDNEGNSIHYTLDNAGNRTQEDTRDEQGLLLRTLSQVYNQLGQLQTHKDAYQRPTGYTYDANGNANTVTDALGRVTDNDYDPLNRLSRTLQDVAGIAADTQFEYDAQDNLTKVTDPKGLGTSYTYNGLGDLIRLSSPDTGVTDFIYDSAGNRKTQTDARGVSSSYSYDALNRLTAIAYADGSAGTSYTYDDNSACGGVGEAFNTGRLSAINDASGSTAYCYDRFGNLVSKTQTVNGKSFTVRYAYTLSGRLRQITYPNGLAVDYVRDAQGRTTEVGVTRPDDGTSQGGIRQVLLRGATYYPFGPAAEWTYGNGRLMRRSLNQNYQPGFVEDPFPGGISLGYEFDAVGNLSKLRSADQADPPQRQFGYDGLNRLTETRDGTTAALLQGYGYDDTGNRTSVTDGGSTTPYVYPTGNHRLTEVGGVTRGYDSAGNTIAIGGTAKEFVYNAANRMSQVKAGGAVATNYAYNGKGEQVRKFLGTTSTYTVYDEAGHWLGDYDSNGALIQQAIWLDDLPVGLVVGDGNKLHYVQPDALGTPRVVIDPVRDVAVWRWDLTGEAFGATLPNQNPDGDADQFVFDMRYPGQRYDATSGLNYNYFRDYEPGTGRYAQSDPIGIAGDMATYGYGGGNPLAAYDRYGLCWSNARATGHYFASGGRTVSLNEIGCASMVASQVQPERTIWKSRMKAAARAAAQGMTCGSWKRITASRSVGVSSGIFWIGGFSLLQDSNCVVQRNCGTNAGMQCGRDSYSFECLLTSQMHDLFVNPSDLDNSAHTSSPDFWDEYSYGGTPFYVDAAWHDSIKGGGSL